MRYKAGYETHRGDDAVCLVGIVGFRWREVGNVYFAVAGVEWKGQLIM
jgi:hypothetical protein